MFRAKGTVKIARPATAVSAFLADPGNENRWQRDVLHLQLLKGTAGIPGATYERVQEVGGKKLKTETRLVEHVEGKSVAFDNEGKVAKFRTYYALREDGGSTVVEMDIEGELLGFASMFEGMAQDAIEKDVAEALRRLPAAIG